MLAGASVERVLNGLSCFGNLLRNLVQVDLIGSEHLLSVVDLLPSGG